MASSTYFRIFGADGLLQIYSVESLWFDWTKHKISYGFAERFSGKKEAFFFFSA